MVDQEYKIENIREYLKDIIDIGKSESIITNCLNSIREISPIDAPVAFAKMERITNLSDDLAWIISILNRRNNEMKRSVQKLKDPKYVALVRQNRPSSAAIEAEIRLTNKEVVEFEDKISRLENVIEYLNHIQKSLDSYLWILRDKIQYCK